MFKHVGRVDIILIVFRKCAAAHTTQRMRAALRVSLHVICNLRSLTLQSSTLLGLRLKYSHTLDDRDVL